MTRSKPPDEMSDAELAEYHREHRDDELGEEVDFEVAKPLRVTMSFRLPAEEADVIREAAAAAGTSLSEWIRWATMRAAHDTDVPPPGMRRSPAPGNYSSRQSTSWAACSARA
ncbi:MAG: hypothetical protein LC808_31010 [Actinobacteria bacterium]|nr:hypothetical protein [Actinomycetota bacterium]